MTVQQKLSGELIESICKVIADTNTGLSGAEIDRKSVV